MGFLYLEQLQICSQLIVLMNLTDVHLQVIMLHQWKSICIVIVGNLTDGVCFSVLAFSDL